MNDIVKVPTPNAIAANLESIAGMIREFEGDEQQKKLAIRMLSTAASNIALLFELKADENGEYRLETYGHAWMLADLLRAGDMVPSSYKTPEQVVIGLMKAMEIGVSPISGLANIMIVNNRPSVWGDLAQAMVQRSDAIANHEKVEVGTKPAPGLELKDWPDDYGWRVSFWRRGQEKPYSAEYTVADARRAGLWMNTKKQPWITDPATMLFNRARARALREGFADKLFGMGIIEEQRDFEREAPPQLLANETAGQPALADDEPVTSLIGQETMPEYSERPQPGVDGPAGDDGPEPSGLVGAPGVSIPHEPGEQGPVGEEGPPAAEPVEKDGGEQPPML